MYAEGGGWKGGRLRHTACLNLIVLGQIQDGESMVDSSVMDRFAALNRGPRHTATDYNFTHFRSKHLLLDAWAATAAIACRSRDGTTAQTSLT